MSIDDLAVSDGKAHDRKRPSLAEHDPTGGSVDQRRPGDNGWPLSPDIGERLLGDSLPRELPGERVQAPRRSRRGGRLGLAALLANSLQGRPVAVVGASTSIFGAIWAQADVRKVLAATGAQVLDAELPVARAADAFDADSELRDPDLRASLAEIAGELVGVAAVLEPQAA